MAYDDLEETQMRSRKLHKLGLDVPFHDLEPPVAVMAYDINEINLLLETTSQNAPSWRRRDSLSDRSVVGSEVHRPTTESCSSDEELIGPEVGETAFADDKDARSHYANEFFSRKHKTCRTEWNNMNILQLNQFSSDLQAHSDKNMSIQEGYLHVISPESAHNCLLVESMLQLVDSALRLSIHKGAKLNKGVKAKNLEQLHHLSAVAPSLWSPGYLNNISSRAVFIPTIAYALNNVCSSGVRIDGFNIELKQSNLPTTKTEEPIEILTSGLWRSLQTHLINVDAARRLKPLFETKSQANVGMEDVHEMLDANHGATAPVSGSTEYQHLEEFEYNTGFYEDHSTLEDDLLDSPANLGHQDGTSVVEDVMCPVRVLNQPIADSPLDQLLDKCQRYQTALPYESQSLFAPSSLHGCHLLTVEGSGEDSGDELLSLCESMDTPNPCEGDSMMLDS